MPRRALHSDASSLASIHVETWRAAYAGLLPPGFLETLDIDTRRSWWEGRLTTGGTTLVDECDGEVVGFCSIGASTDEGWGEVFAIYVLAEHWGHGHGSRLIEAGCDSLAEDGYSRASLWVLEANTRARAFYEREGWSRSSPIRIEEIGGAQVIEVRYERPLPAAGLPDPDPTDR